jgi:hypothetical protein
VAAGSLPAPDDGAVDLDPLEDTGFFPGTDRELADDYVARTNTVQSVGAPLLPEGRDAGAADGWVFVANEVGRG